MHSLSWVRSAAALASGSTPSRGTQYRIKQRVCLGVGCQVSGVSDLTPAPDTWHLSLRELEPLARPGPARFLALHHPRIARQQALLPRLLAVPFVGEAQRPPDGEPQRPRLPRHPAAPHQRPHVERAERVGRRERLLDVRHERWPGEVIAQGALVDVPLARAGGQVHPRHAHLATPDRVPAQLRCDRGHAVAESTSGCGCCAACGCVGPAYTLSICFTFWRDSVVFGNIPHTAFSITRSGCLASKTLSGVNRSCPM